MNCRTYTLERGSDALRAVHAVAYAARNKFAWPGGYLMFAGLSDGEALCPDCCRAEFASIARATMRPGTDAQWQAIGVDSAANYDELESCVHCNRELSTL